MTFVIKSSGMPQVLPQQGEVRHTIDRRIKCTDKCITLQMKQDVRSLNFGEIQNITSLLTSDSMLGGSKEDCYFFVIHHSGHGSPLLLCTTSSVSISKRIRLHCKNRAVKVTTW